MDICSYACFHGNTWELNLKCGDDKNVLIQSSQTPAVSLIWFSAVVQLGSSSLDICGAVILSLGMNLIIKPQISACLLTALPAAGWAV